MIRYGLYDILLIIIFPKEGKFASMLKNNLALNELNLTELKPLAIYLYRPLYVERFVLCSAHLALDFIGLLEGTFRMELMGVKTSSLLPVALFTGTDEFGFDGSSCVREVVDEYLIYVAENYGRRRNCQVKLSSTLPAFMMSQPGIKTISTSILPVWRLYG